ncbi:MAG TPA: NIPSNAP family protein [Flavisolibacter sp.]|nr:NIPSNAP family protein [Flavisolibacter sp.]
MKRATQLSSFFIFFLLICCGPDAKAQQRQYIELRVYHLADTAQLSSVHRFLQTAYLPALHKQGIKTVGVFTAIGNDTAADKRIYVLTPFASLKKMEELPRKLEKDAQYQENGAAYLNAAHNGTPYKRFETILLQAFEFMPAVVKPQLTGDKSNRVYELRSYEGPTEKFYKNKVQMFNQGGEIDIFKRLGFNAVFYGEVLFGSRMPNLMYMTSFENKAARDAHWKAFGEDAAWKKLSAMPEYKNNVSKNEIVFLTPADYSDL